MIKVKKNNKRAIALDDTQSICQVLGATFDSVKHKNEIESLQQTHNKQPIKEKKLA